MYLDDKFEAIQRYMTGQMTAAEITDFESELQQSPELAAELHQLRTLRIVAKHEELFKTKRLLDKLRIEKPLIPDFSDEKPPTNPPSAPPTLPNALNSWLLGGLIGTALLSLVYWGYQRNATEQYYKQLVINVLLKPADNIIGLDKSIPPQSQEQILEREAMDLYDARNYQAAISKFDALSKLFGHDSVKYKSFVPFYLAMSHLQLQQTVEAEAILKQLVVFKADGIMYEEACQYLPVALLANGKIKEAKVFLKLSEAERKMKYLKPLLKIVNEEIESN